MKKIHRPPLWLAIAIATYGLACRVIPGFARAALNRLSLPAMAGLHRLTAPVPFPVAEALALGMAATLIFTLVAAMLRACASGGIAPLARWLRGAGWTALLLGGALVLLWSPALALPSEAAPSPDDRQLAWLCEDLIDRLNASELAFPEAAESLRRAPAVAGMARGAVKAVRYPEWMRLTGISGIFVPLTGEALADPGMPAALLPFTAVHELAHLAGIADEGAANIVAWQRCLDAGGPFADSARLWALRYAMGMLRQRDRTAWIRAGAKMEGPLKRTFQECGGEAGAPTPSGRIGLPLSRGDYAAVVNYLATDAAP